MSTGRNQQIVCKHNLTCHFQLVKSLSHTKKEASVNTIENFHRTNVHLNEHMHSRKLFCGHMNQNVNFFGRQQMPHPPYKKKKQHYSACYQCSVQRPASLMVGALVPKA